MSPSPRLSKGKMLKFDKKTLGPVAKRLFGMMFSFFPVLLPTMLIFILINAIVSSVPAVFMQKVVAVIETSYKSGDWSMVGMTIIRYVLILSSFYLISLIAGTFYNQIGAIITQGTLKKLRERMFNGMQDLPVKYFDSNKHGDIMSRYTNDIDTLRQMISQSLPQFIVSAVSVLTILAIMIYYSLDLTLVVLIGVIFMFKVVKLIGGGSARYFVRQQEAVGRVEAFIEEMMNGQKVVKVFCHEDEAKAEFDRLNADLFDVSRKGNGYANILGPATNNIGNILYVMIAITGGLLIGFKAPNISISGMAIGISIVVPFLNMTRRFCGSIGQVSNQLNAVIMGFSGAVRIFELMDQKAEDDNGYVMLVNATEENGELKESDKRTGLWAWKHPHQADGSVSYQKLEGKVTLSNVDFAYEEGKDVLHDVTLTALPGQKIAFVGATGAGKTTITNLLNRFYDIADGKIRYDDININKIKKADLRHSLGIVLQETNLFTGTVMENIRYGKLDASDEECIKASKLAGADDFIRRLPKGYDTMLTENGANISQGQRQLLSIARAAVADPPVMILDEATSSIDTRTEKTVQKGMDAIMKGRTTFVIAHRLSTVKDADVIIVLDHGRIIERGTHDELIDLKGQYYRLYTGAFA